MYVHTLDLLFVSVSSQSNVHILFVCIDFVVLSLMYVFTVSNVSVYCC